MLGSQNASNPGHPWCCLVVGRTVSLLVITPEVALCAGPKAEAHTASHLCKLCFKQQQLFLASFSSLGSFQSTAEGNEHVQTEYN
jgi:hypothetical protein